MRRKNLPKTIIAYKNKKETILELQKTIRVLAYNLEIRNLLLKI